MRNTLLLPYRERRESRKGKLRDLYNYTNIRKSILMDPGKDVYDFICEHVNPDSERAMVFKTRTSFNIFALSDNYFNALVNLGRVNDVNGINRFFEVINQKLPLFGIFVCCVETKNERKQRILKKYPVGIAHVYYMLDFIFKRILPKLPGTRSLYMKLTGGRNRVLSRTEVLGRLYSCGFGIVDEKEIGGKTYFVMKKMSEPCYDEEPSYGPICKMKRFGKGGKVINVYKFRTMHPYAEYLQQYVYEQNNLQEGGKFKNDFRISTMGRFMRKYWIDELPMLVNLIKGDIKLVGVRPLSKQYLGLYSENVKSQRIKVKPGLIPPFYADLPKTLEEIMDSEMKYLEQYERSPFTTDARYFFRSCKQILFNHARSN